MIFGMDPILVYIIMATCYITITRKTKVQYKYRSSFPRELRERALPQNCFTCNQRMLSAASEQKMLPSGDEEASNKIAIASTGCELTDEIFAAADKAGLNSYEEIGSPVPGSQEESF